MTKRPLLFVRRKHKNYFKFAIKPGNKVEFQSKFLFCFFFFYVVYVQMYRVIYYEYARSGKKARL